MDQYKLKMDERRLIGVACDGELVDGDFDHDGVPDLLNADADFVPAFYFDEFATNAHQWPGKDLDLFSWHEVIARELYLDLVLLQDLFQCFNIFIANRGCLPLKGDVTDHMVGLQCPVVVLPVNVHKNVTRQEGHLDQLPAVAPLAKFFLQGQISFNVFQDKLLQYFLF